ncbi:MAG: hypothetical protein IJO31_05500, partial [Oscillospiraceae bacterium]|nr:hypothetical protein [Oscillospiraceae bacterium]
PTDADRYDPSSDIWSCSHPGYAEGNCRLCGKPCPGHTYDNACDDKCNVCSEIREVGDHVYDGAEDAECNECGYVRDITPVQITGVSITIDGVVYDSSNTSAEDPAVVTPDSNVILTITGTSLHSGSDDHTVDYANGLYLYVNPDYFEISEDGTTATYAPSTGDFAKSSNFEITYCNNYTDTANRTVVPTGIYLTYDDGISEEDQAQITGMSITIDGVVYDSSNTSAEDPAVITPNTEFITITVHGTALQNCTTDHVISYYSGSSQPILADYLWHFEADGTGAYHYYSSASALSDFARNTTPYELQYSNNGSFNAANPAIGSGVYIVYDDSTGGEEPASCTCVTKCAEGSVNSECTVCSAEGADLNGCTGEEATADDEDGWFTVSGNTVTIDGTLGGKTTATEDDVNTLLEAITGYVGSGITTIIVTGSNPAVIEVSGIVMPAVSEAIYRLSKEESYNGKIDLILQDVTEIMEFEFYDAFALNSITLPNVMKLGDSAFFGCYYLEKMTFGLVLTEIQNTSGATFYWVGEEVGGCDLVLNCGQMQGATDYQPNIGTDTWCYTEFKSITLAHTGGEATCTVQAVCSVCGDSYGELADHTTENDVCTLCGAMEIVVSFDAGDYNWETGDQINLSRQSTDDYGDPVHTNYYFTATVAEDGTVTWTPDKSLYSDGTGEHTLAVSYPNMDLLYQNFSIPGDQSTLEKLREADCMNAIWSGNPTTDPITLNLTHRLAKVTVDYEVPEGVAVSKAEIYTLTQYLLFDLNTLERRDITGEEGDDLWINSYHNGNQFTAFVSPDAYAADGNFIRITLSDGTVREVKMTKAVTFEEGGEYTYKVIITADGAYLTCADECSFAYTDNGDGTHDATCTVCGAVVEDEAHSGGTATCTKQAECQHCGASYGEVDVNNHNWENGVCTYECGTTHDPHTFENGICTVCGKEDTTPAEITGVSITVDGETYTEGDVTITPTSTIIVTVTGTNFANLSAANILDLGPGLTVFMDTWRWETDPAANTATADFSDLNPEFGDHNGSEITYSNDSNQNWTGTGIYLTYDDGTGGEEDTTPDSTGKILVDMQDSYGDGWNDAAIQIYKNGSLEQTVTVDKTSNTVFLDYDSTATYEFKWIKGGYDYECSFTIYEDGEEKLSVTDASVYENGETIWPQGDTGGEEDTTPAQITGVSIVIDGEEYVGSDTSAENPAVITSEAASVILTVHGTNLQYATDKQWVSYMSTGNCVTLDNSDWTKSEDGSRASLDMTWLADAFTQSVSVWEIKYSNDGGGLEDAVTGLYVKYEHIPEEALWGTDGDNLTNGGTFAEAIAAAGADSDITYIRLGTDVTDDWGYEIESGVFTLDLNGHTLKADEFYALTLKNAGTVVTLTDTAGGGAAIGGSTFAAVLASDGAKVLINGGSYSGLDAISANSGGFVEINGGSFTGNGGFAVAVGESSNAEITGGSFSGAFCSVNSGGTTTITGGSFGVGEYGHFAYSAGKLDLSGYNQEKLNGLKLSYRTENDLTVSDENIKLPEGYVFQDSEGNTVTTLTGYIIYTIGAAGTADEEEPIVIIQQPTDGEAKLGERYCVEVIAQGEGLKYQWYFRNAGASNWNKSSVTDNTYDDVMTTARMNRQVYCVITDSHGNSVTTDTASLIALKSVDLAVTTLPESVTVNYGERFTLTVEAVGDGVTYEWYYLDPDGEAWLSTNVRSATYSGKMSEKIDGRAVYCVASDIWGNQVATNSVFLRCERAELAITKQPNDASAKLGERFNVEVIAQGDGLKYQWYFRKVGAENWSVSGVKDNTYDDVMTTARHNREVYCVITDAWGNSVTTDIATITGTAAAELAITRQPESQTVTIGDMFNVTFDAVGDGLRYQWYFRQAGTEVWYTSGQKDNSYDDVMTKARHNRELYCVVTDAWGNTVETSPVVVIMAAPRHELAITAQPENESAKLGDMFCVTVEAQGDELRYQWYWRNVGSETWHVSGQRDNTYDDVMTRARHNREVKCVITDMWGESVETNVATITGTPTQTLAITQQPTDGHASMGEGYFVEVIAQGDDLRYQWYFRNAGASHWNKSGVTDNTYDDVMTKARAGRQVYCVITDAWGHSVTTETVTLVCN